MEPLNDKELNRLLRQWEAPRAPADLRKRIGHLPGSRWLWFLTGSIRVPVPVGIAAAVILALWIWVSSTPPAPIAQPPGSITLGDFQAVQQLEPRIVGSNSERKTNENQQQK